MEKNRYKDWDLMDLATLRREFPKRPTNEVAQMLGRSYQATAVKAFKMGLKKEVDLVSVEWTPQMLKLLRDFFPTMFNRDLAKLLKVSPRTLNRKAKELGLEKIPDFFTVKRRAINARSGAKTANATSFKPGQHANPAGEFKTGHKLTAEQEARRSESLKATWKRRKILIENGIVTNAKNQ